MNNLHIFYIINIYLIYKTLYVVKVVHVILLIFIACLFIYIQNIFKILYFQATLFNSKGYINCGTNGKLNISLDILVKQVRKSCIFCSTLFSLFNGKKCLSYNIVSYKYIRECALMCTIFLFWW